MKKMIYTLKLISIIFFIVFISEIVFAVNTFGSDYLYNLNENKLLDHEKLNIVSSIQKKNDNFFSTIQKGYSNKTFIFQMDNNDLFILQKGMNNIIKSSQYGKYNSTVIKQFGINKVTEIDIIGNDNTCQIMDNRLSGKSKLFHSANSKNIKVLFDD